VNRPDEIDPIAGIDLVVDHDLEDGRATIDDDNGEEICLV
jgi:hypothetical protein